MTVKRDVLPIDYLDLDFSILSLQEEGYPAQICLEEQFELAQGYVPADIVSFVNETQDPEQQGIRLFEKVFSDSNLKVAWEEVRSRAPLCRIRLQTDPEAKELLTLPWELLRDKYTLISTNIQTPFSRYIPSTARYELSKLTDEIINILVLIPNPNDLHEKYGVSGFDASLERTLFERVLQTAGLGRTQIDFLNPPITIQKIQAALRKEYQIVHFCGHTHELALCLQDEQGNTQLASGDLLTSLLQSKTCSLVLQACGSSRDTSTDVLLKLSSQLLGAGVPAVISMQNELSNASARNFTKVFYNRLLESGIVDVAMNEARHMLASSHKLGENDIPKLFMRVKDGQLWKGRSDLYVPTYCNEMLSLDSETKLYAFARFKGCQTGMPLQVRRNYVLQVGIGQLDAPSPIIIKKLRQFDISLVAPEMEIYPLWVQSISLAAHNAISLVEFTVVPQTTGIHPIRVDIYYQRHWLAQLKFNVEADSSQSTVL